MTHDDHRLLTAGAALGDLDPDEWPAAVEHQAACGDCARLSVELRASLTDLALLAPRRMPPPALAADILAAIRADGAAVRAPAGLGPRPFALMDTRPRALAPRRRPSIAVLGLAAALVVALGLGASAVRLGADLDQTRSEAATLRAEAAGNDALMAAIADPAHRTARLQPEALAPDAAAVVVYVPGSTEAWIVADRMPATPAGQAYEVWYADAAGAHPLETATWNGQGVMVAPVAVDLARSTAVMVTLEPAGGATVAPGPQVVFGELASSSGA